MKKKLPEKMKKRLIVSPKKRIREFVENFKELQGDPHYVATGIAIGVFIGVTPTIPFHMILALIFAYVFRCSGPALMIQMVRV